MPDERVKDKVSKQQRIVSQLSPDMQAFHGELSKVSPDIEYTSGKRSAKQGVGKSHNTSHHNTGNAGDFSKNDYKIYDYLMNTQEGLALLDKYDLGIIDETDPETLKSTGGTAPHFHVGKDSYYAKIAKDRLRNFENITPVYSYISGNKSSGEVQNFKGNSNYTAPVENQNISVSVPFRLDSGQVVSVPINTQVFEQELKKEEIKQDMIEKSSARQKIETEQENRINFLKDFQGANYVNPESSQGVEVQEDFPVETQQVDVQNSLPEMPNLFKIV